MSVNTCSGKLGLLKTCICIPVASLIHINNDMKVYMNILLYANYGNVFFIQLYLFIFKNILISWLYLKNKLNF